MDRVVLALPLASVPKAVLGFSPSGVSRCYLEQAVHTATAARRSLRAADLRDLVATGLSFLAGFEVEDLGIYFFGGEIVSFTVFDTLNLTVVFAPMLIASPV